MARVYIVFSYIFDIACIVLIVAFVVDTMFLNQETGFSFKDLLIPFAIISRGLTGLYFVYGTQKLYFKPKARKDLLDEEWHQEFPVSYGILAPGIFNIILTVVFIVFFIKSFVEFVNDASEEGFEMIAFFSAILLLLVGSIFYVIGSFVKTRRLYISQKQND